MMSISFVTSISMVLFKISFSKIFEVEQRLAIQSTFEYRTMSGSSNGKVVRLSNDPVFEWHLKTGLLLSGYRMVNHFPFENRTDYRMESHLPFENRTIIVRFSDGIRKPDRSTTGQLYHSMNRTRSGIRMATVFRYSKTSF